ncbi:MAG: ATP-binding protein [Myxococcales bacterium]|nr:ATP-binding protein [Myxococcales bacterium]
MVIAAYDELRARLGDQHLLFTTSIQGWNLSQYAEAGYCRLEPLAGIDNLFDAQVEVHPPSVAYSLYLGGFEIDLLDGRRVQALQLRWWSDCGLEAGLFLWGPTRELVETFAMGCAEYTHEVHGEILAFSDGYWAKSEALFQAVQGVTFDDVVLPQALKYEVEGDIEHFLANRGEYERLGVPWKRGILFVGPPGNGKTHCIKAIVNRFALPCLYVQSFESRHDSSEHNIQLVFERARKTTPCLLVLEDLDALITPRNRSFFLNQLDGFHRNIGVITIASTNHPERLDPAIVDRPSRFDRKYHFWLPEETERRAYLELWNQRLHAEMRIDESELCELVSRTDGFSYAYLKELMLSGVMAWISSDRSARIAPLIGLSLQTLREQMHSEATRTAATSSDEAEADADDDSFAH